MQYCKEKNQYGCLLFCLTYPIQPASHGVVGAEVVVCGTEIVQNKFYVFCCWALVAVETRGVCEIRLN